MMSPLESLYYAIGELAYAVAASDGEVQKEERKRLHQLVVGGLKEKAPEPIDVSEIIFKLLDKQDTYDPETAYNWAMNTIRTNGHYLSPELKQKFIRVMEEIAAAYPPVTSEERDLIKRFKKDIEPIVGDPVYYNVT
jgi:uncharacterized tellurite resistance protein B-like protein